MKGLIFCYLVLGEHTEALEIIVILDMVAHFNAWNIYNEALESLPMLNKVPRVIVRTLN